MGAKSDKVERTTTGKIRSHWRLVNVLALSVCCAHYLIYIWLIAALRFEPQALNWWFDIRGAITRPKDVTIITIDERGHKELNIPFLNRFPRTKIAELLERLSEYKPRRVAVDLLLSDTNEDPAIDERLGKALALNTTFIGGAAPLSGHPGDLMAPRAFFTGKAPSAGTMLPVDEGTVRRFGRADRSDATSGRTLAEAAAGIGDVDGLSAPGRLDFINYYGPSGTIRRFSVADILMRQHELPSDAFTDKVVFIGVSLPNTSKDYFTVPLKKAIMEGVEIHATAAANIMHRQWIRRFDLRYEVLVHELILFFLVFLLFSLSPIKAVIVWLAVTIGWAVISYQAFLRGYFIPGVLAVKYFLPLVCGASILYRYWSQRWLKQAFKYYLSPAMVEMISQEPQKLGLGGEIREATLFFTDIQSFTKLVEKLEPTAVSALLNRYFSVVANIILDASGTLIKFVGDGTYAAWGVPVPVKDSPDRALQSALAIQRDTAALASAGELPEIRTRVGIHHGKVVAGNLGSSKRFDYTAVGDPVNLASRLEQLNKKFDTNILLTQDVVNLLKENYPLVPIGTVKVYGRDEETELYTVFEPPLAEETLRHWLRGLELLKEGQVEAAKVQIADAGKGDARLRTASQLIIQHIALHAGDGAWRGVLRFDEK